MIRSGINPQLHSAVTKAAKALGTPEQAKEIGLRFFEAGQEDVDGCPDQITLNHDVFLDQGERIRGRMKFDPSNAALTAMQAQVGNDSWELLTLDNWDQSTLITRNNVALAPGVVLNQAEVAYEAAVEGGPQILASLKANGQREVDGQKEPIGYGYELKYSPHNPKKVQETASLTYATPRTPAERSAQAEIDRLLPLFSKIESAVYTTPGQPQSYLSHMDRKEFEVKLSTPEAFKGSANFEKGSDDLVGFHVFNGDNLALSMSRGRGGQRHYTVHDHDRAVTTKFSLGFGSQPVTYSETGRYITESPLPYRSTYLQFD